MKYYLEQFNLSEETVPGAGRFSPVDVAVPAVRVTANAERIVDWFHAHGKAVKVMPALGVSGGYSLYSVQAGYTYIAIPTRSTWWPTVYSHSSALAFREVERFLYEALMTGEAFIDKSLPANTTSNALGVWSIEPIESQPHQKQLNVGLIHRRGFFAEPFRVHYLCRVGSWEISRPNTRELVVHNLADRTLVRLRTLGTSPIAALNAIAKHFGAGTVPAGLSMDALGHRAFSARLRRTMKNVALYERLLLGYPFDWVAVDRRNGSFARSVSPAAALHKLGQDELETDNPVL